MKENKHFKSIFREYDDVIFGVKDYFCNEIINTLPSHKLRIFLYKKVCGISIGKDTSIGLHTVISDAANVSIGSNCAIGQFVYLDGRGGLTIGNNVNISGRTSIYTASHNHKSPRWEYIKSKTVIDDNVWIASNSVVIQGIHIGKGSIVAAGSVVVKNVENFDIVGGNPAKKISKRSRNIQYITKYFPYFH